MCCCSELTRLELKAVPYEVVLTFLHEWGEHRVAKGSTEIGIPHGPMPISVELLGNKGDMGLKLIFLASPTDTLEVLPFSLRDGMSSAIVLRYGEPRGAAICGHLGPQMSSLMRSAESDIRMKLHIDAEEIARRYILLQRARKGVVNGAYISDHHQSSFQDTELPEHSPIFMGGEMRDVLSAYPGGKKELESKLKDSLRDTLNVKELEENLNFRVPEEWEEVKGENESFESKQKQVYGFQGVIEEFRIKKGKDEFHHVFNAGEKNAKRQSEVLKKQQQPQLRAIALEDGLAQLEVALTPGLQGGLDIFAGPPKLDYGARKHHQGRDFPSSSSPSSSSPVDDVYVMCNDEDKPLLELTEQEFLALDQEKLQVFVDSLSVLIDELIRSPKDMWPAILREYNDVLLHEYFVLCMRARLSSLCSKSERAVLQAIQSRAMLLVQELALVKQQDEMAQLEKIRDICLYALEYMSSLPEKVRAMKPLLDSSFVAYLMYAIDREWSMLKDPVNSPSLWLKVLQVIQRGTIAELSRDIRYQVEDISYVLRMEEPEERQKLLKTLIDTMPTLDVRKFREVGRNIVAGITSAPPVLVDKGKAAKTAAPFNKGDYGGTELLRSLHSSQAVIPNLRDRVIEFGTMLEEYLTDERVEKLSKEADEWAAQSMADASSLRSRAEREVLEINNRRISLKEIPGAPISSANTLLHRLENHNRNNDFMLSEEFNDTDLLCEDPGKIIDAEVVRISNDEEGGGVLGSEEENEWGDDFHDGDFQPVDDDFLTSTTNGNCPRTVTEKDSCSESETTCTFSFVEEVADDWKGVYDAASATKSNCNSK